ncbi:MAG TPA: protein kinase, partial [Pirellulales bacterium]|nr:protein kinase [Pirellulales bacterium]
MHEPESVSGEGSTTARDRRFDRVCDEFEAHLKAGSSPRLEEYLATVPFADQRELLGQLLPLEVSYLAERGDRPLPEAYHARFAEHADTIAAVFDKIGPRAALNAGHLATTQAFGPTIEPGAVIAGRYKVLQTLGEGGMGTVYAAEQEQPVKRRVALKLIKPGMDSAQVLRRFEAERQALALMDHLNIARVLDGGATPSGRPFFVMELVHGVPITKFCDDNQLTPRQRLELF